MGQTASLPPRVRSLAGKDLAELTDPELEFLVDMHPWTKEQVFKVSKTLQEDAPRDKVTTVPLTGFYAQQEDSAELDIAVRVNALSQEVSHLRFQLVPSKVKEPIFWESILVLLEERLDEHKNISQEPSQNGESHTLVADTNGATNSDASSRKLQSLEKQLRAKDAQIVDLKNQVEELQSRPGASRTPKHSGKWIPDRDSEEFWQYPDEVKENMRAEKQRRLKQVRDDMRFILDSDDIEDSNGQWSCCGDTDYHSTKPCGK